MFVAGGVVALAVVVLVALVTTGAGSGGSGSTPPASTPAGPVAALSAIPATQLDTELRALGPQLGTPLTPINGPALDDGGKPEVLFVGAEYCPYCAAERWAIVTALSHFGTFSGLEAIRSSSTDVYPDTPTVSFRAARFTSAYLSFTAVETETRTHAPLETPSAAQVALWSKYANGAIPFIDFAGRFELEGATYSPQLFAGLTTDQASAAATDATTLIGKAVQTVAGYFVAKLCTITGGQPTNVCSAFPPE
jgi:hypothetical protein